MITVKTTSVEAENATTITKEVRLFGLLVWKSTSIYHREVQEQPL